MCARDELGVVFITGVKAYLDAMQRILSPVLLYTIFFFTGIATVLLGVLLPYIHAVSSQEDLHTGWLLASQFIGQLIGALFVGRRPSRSVGFGLLLTLSCAAAVPYRWGLNPVTQFFYGLGLGITMTAVNILAGREATPEKRASRLQMLNVFWPLGAAAAPWCVAAIVRSFHPETACIFLAITLGFLLLLFSLNMRGASRASIAQKTVEHPLPWYRLLLYCSIALLCVGVETALANWLPSYSARSLSHTGSIAAAASLFWCGVLSGRLSAASVFRNLPWNIYGTASAIACILASLALILSSSPLLICISSFVAAFGVAPLYPAVLARSIHVRLKNLIFFSAGIGSAAVPWLVGRVSYATDSLKEALLVPTIAAVLLALGLCYEPRAMTPLTITFDGKDHI